MHQSNKAQQRAKCNSMDRLSEKEMTKKKEKRKTHSFNFSLFSRASSLQKTSLSNGISSLQTRAISRCCTMKERAFQLYIKNPPDFFLSNEITPACHSRKGKRIQLLLSHYISVIILWQLQGYPELHQKLRNGGELPIRPELTQQLYILHLSTRRHKDEHVSIHIPS